MLDAFLIGLIATSSLILGGLIASWFNLSNKTIGIIMGFGAGTLISAVSYELIYEALKLGKGSGYPAYGFFVGAFTFYFSDRLIEKLGANNPTSIAEAKNSNLIVPMLLAIILDGVPESIVIGLGIRETGSVSMAMLVAVFISNLPESIAGSNGMKENGRSVLQISGLWVIISLVCSLATLAGFSLFSGASNEWLSFIQAFAGGAILMMLANAMMPEAFEHGGKVAGVATVMGFFLSVCILMLEHSHS